MSQPTVEDFTRFFLEEYEPASGPIEDDDAIPPDLLKAAAEAGAYRLTIPVEHGGWGLSVREYLPYLEGAAKGHGSGRMLVHLTNGVWRPLLTFGNEQQRGLVSGMASGDTVVAFCLTE